MLQDYKACTEDATHVKKTRNSIPRKMTAKVLPKSSFSSAECLRGGLLGRLFFIVDPFLNNPSYEEEPPKLRHTSGEHRN